MLLSGSSFSWPYMATMWHTMWRQLAAAWSTPYGFPPYLPSQRFDPFQRYQREVPQPEDAVTSSSEFHENDNEYFGSRSREPERSEPCTTFDPLSAFYAPKSSEQQDGYDAQTTTNETQKNAQKASMLIDNLLNIRNQESCSISDLKQWLSAESVVLLVQEFLLFLCKIYI